MSGRVQSNAASPQIKNGLLVQLADRRAVRAFHIVGIDLELRFGVHRRLVAEQDVLVGLLRVGLLRDRMHENAAVKHALRFVVQDSVEIFVTRAVRLSVFDNHVMIGELLAFRQVKAVEDALQPFTSEPGENVVPRNSGAQRE